MASEEPAVTTEIVQEATANDPMVEEKPAANAAKTKKAKDPKPKKASAPKKRSAPSHPPYEEVLSFICHSTYT